MWDIFLETNKKNKLHNSLKNYKTNLLSIINLSLVYMWITVAFKTNYGLTSLKRFVNQFSTKLCVISLFFYHYVKNLLRERPSPHCRGG